MPKTLPSFKDVLQIIYSRNQTLELGLGKGKGKHKPLKQHCKSLPMRFTGFAQNFWIYHS
jgi:hypothetical protein